MLYFWYEFTEKLSAGSNVGYNYFGTGNGHIPYSFSLNYFLSDNVAVYGEIFGENQNLNTSDENFSLGITYQPNVFFQIDLSAARGLDQSMQYYCLGLNWWIINTE